MIVSLKELGHTVAMTGDGVNDILAFKEADCSIAMASGSDAAKNAANLVLLDNNFSAMPHIVNEGRRVINNITKSASMFLIKTIFSIFISISTIFFGQTYPFDPIQLSLISSFGVGIPTFLLTYESNFTKISGNFFRNILENALPSAFIIALGATLITNIGHLLGYDNNMLSTLCVLFTGWNYAIALKRVYAPLTLYRKLVIYITQFIYYLALIIGRSLLELTELPFVWLIILLGLFALSLPLTELVQHLFIKLEKLIIRYREKKI